jgi:hypothetical protein
VALRQHQNTFGWCQPKKVLRQFKIVLGQLTIVLAQLKVMRCGHRPGARFRNWRRDTTTGRNGDEY